MCTANKENHKLDLAHKKYEDRWAVLAVYNDNQDHLSMLEQERKRLAEGLTACQKRVNGLRAVSRGLRDEIAALKATIKEMNQ